MTQRVNSTLGLLFAGAVTLAPIANEASAQSAADGRWHNPDAAEFFVDLPVRHLLPTEHTVTERIGIDCDLLLKSGDKLVVGGTGVTSGFAMQMNVETPYTLRSYAETDRREGLAPGTTLGLLQQWRGQMNPNNLDGALQTHLGPIHNIQVDTHIKPTVRRCQQDFPDHGTRIQDLRAIGGPNGIHPDWD